MLLLMAYWSIRKAIKEQNSWLVINKFPLKLHVSIGSVIQFLMFQPGFGHKNRKQSRCFNQREWEQENPLQTC